MLQLIRERLAGGIALTILGLIGVTFVFFGVSNTPFLNAPYAASVDGSEIGVAEFEQTYRNQMQQNPSLAQLPEEFRLQIRRSVLDSLVRNRLVDLHLAEAGYRISDEQVMREVQRVPDFQVDGVFDMDTYRSVLLQNGYDPMRFEAVQRNAMRQDQLRRAVAATAIVTPSDYRRYLNLVAEQRLVTLATFDIEGASAGVEIGEDDITAFYDQNTALYLTPESVDIEMIEIRRDAIAADVEIPEQRLQEYYEDEKSRYLQDEQRRASHILILADDGEDAALAQAQSIAERAKGGESFADLAREFSQDGGTASNGGDLGALTRTQLPGDLGGAVFSMEEGEIVGPIESDFGFHVVRLDDIVEQGPLPLDQVRGDLLAELKDREAEDLFRSLETQMSDALFDAEDMQTIADATGLDVQAATGITRSGGEPIGNNQNAIDAIFDEQVLTGGEISDIVELDANRSAMFRVAQYREAAHKPLAEVRDEIVETLTAREAQNIVLGRADSLLAALDAGEEFGLAAEAAGATVSAPILIGRQQEDVDQSVVSQVFMVKKPTAAAPVRGRISTSNGGYTVFNLEAVLPGRPESIPVSERDAGKLQLAQQAGIAQYSAFVQALYNDADVVISESALAGQELVQ